MPLVRLQQGSRGALSIPTSSAGDALLRLALEAALVVAREGEEETPALTAPVPLRPFLRFAKLPPKALAATRRVLDTDEEFRGRVAEVAEEATVGRAGWLFLSRPEGWEDELGALVTEAEAAVEEQSDRRAENDARRRLAGAQEATRRAEQVAAAARAEAVQAATALAEERRARVAAAEEAAAAARRAEQVTAERDRARSSAAAAASERDRATAAATAAAAELETLHRRVADLEAEVDRQAAVAALLPPPGAATPEPPVVDSGGPAVQVAEAARALREAAAAAQHLAGALAAAAASFGEPPGRVETTPSIGSTGDGLGGPGPGRVGRRTRPERSDRPGRIPIRLPPAIFDDSVEAAEHLVRVGGVALVVDGYNVSQTGWSELPLVEQRRHLVTALNELAARTGADVWVVFDGADLAMPGVVPSTPQAVRVSFSPPGVEADDEILAMVGQLPAHRPVVVATSDRRVQTGAAAAGANVISSPQLLAVLRR